MKTEKKLIYILNHYSENSAQHFFHVVHLLEELADRGVRIVLVIEKCDDIPVVHNSNIIIEAQRETNKFKRAYELKRILDQYLELGYRKIFVRISLHAAMLSIREAGKFKAEVYFWQSGDNLTYDLQKKGWDKLRYLLCGYAKLKYVARHVNYFVTGPERMITYYMEMLKIPAEKMLLLYNDIDIKRFSACSLEEKQMLRKKLGISSKQKVVLFVHRLTPIKRFYMQIPYVIEEEGFCKANALLVVIGTGPDYERIKNQIQDSPYRDLVRLVGAVPNKQVMDYYKAADVFINPSYSEGFPRVIIEAMACALPVVATDVGGTKDIVGIRQKQYIVGKDQKELFRKQVLRLVENDNLREAIAAENVETAKRYSTEKIAQMYIEGIFK